MALCSSGNCCSNNAKKNVDDTTQTTIPRRNFIARDALCLTCSLPVFQGQYRGGMQAVDYGTYVYRRKRDANFQ